MNDFSVISKRVVSFLRDEFASQYDPDCVVQLRGDASTRQYFRYHEKNRSFILAVYPDPFDLKDFNYQQMYDLFQKIKLPIPAIHTLDSDRGIVLQEDLGDESLQKRLLVANATERKRLFLASIDHIITIQGKGTRSLKPEYQASSLVFDQDKLNQELVFFLHHYLEDYCQINVLDKNRLREEFNRLTAELADLDRCLCHRDYTVRNLILKNNTVYIIDFQDARWGPFSYDLASLLQDSVELDQEEIHQYCEYYLSRAVLSEKPGDFLRHFRLMCIQRLLKALGTYGHQSTAYGKHVYRQYIPGSLRRVLDSIRFIPEFPYTQFIIEKELEY
ncbi:MAG: phosphotransferase [Acidobacteriota bacterium]|nr:phosphotransferase [Acidobacteriota bacterium]